MLRGEVEGDAAGGFAGYSHGAISNCYAVCNVKELDGSGGFACWSGGTINKCFWDVDASQIGMAGDDNYGATGKTTEQMQTTATLVDAGWDFTNETTNGTADIWRLCEDRTDYPRLAWEFGSDYACPDGVSLEDLLYLSSRWLESDFAPYTSADRTGDGKVTMEDYATMSNRWMTVN